MTYTIRSNRTTSHIDGLHVRTQSSGEARGGVVGYYAQNTCGVLTRGYLSKGKTFESLEELLAYCAIPGSRKLCRRCEAAARKQLAEDAEAQPLTNSEAAEPSTGDRAETQPDAATAQDAAPSTPGTSSPVNPNISHLHRGRVVPGPVELHTLTEKQRQQIKALAAHPHLTILVDDNFGQAGRLVCRPGGDGKRG